MVAVTSLDDNVRGSSQQTLLDQLAALEQDQGRAPGDQAGRSVVSEWRDTH